MKTKSLILTALLSVAGSAGLMAQSNVYSLNIVGYVNQVIPVGYSIIANQLNNSPDNQIVNLFAQPPLNTFVYKFDPNSGSFFQMDYQSFGWEGDDLTLTLSPGEGAFIYTPKQFTNTFVGQLQLNSTNKLNGGYSIISSVIPQSADITTMGFTPHVGDNIFQWQNANNSYLGSDYQSFGWEGDGAVGSNGGPVVAVGEGFYFYSTVTNHVAWTRSFSVGP